MQAILSIDFMNEKSRCEQFHVLSDYKLPFVYLQSRIREFLKIYPANEN